MYLICFLLIGCMVAKDYFEFGAKVIPHPDKIAKGGEDAYYADDQLLAIADGVGGWNNQGIDPAKYSRELTANIESYYQQKPEAYRLTPKELITVAAKNTTNKGSSTLVILTLHDDGVLRSSFIGDSGYLIIRPTDERLKLIHESEEQQHSFNYPFQLGNPGDDASNSLEFTHQVKDGDVVVVGSDGLFDNLTPAMIVKFLNEQISENGSIRHDEDARELAQYAFNFSLDRNHKSPFAKRAKKAGRSYKGGKSDDITVILATIRLEHAKHHEDI